MTTTRSEKLALAMPRYDAYMQHKHVARFVFTHHEVFQRFVEKPNKTGALTKSVTEQWVEDLGTCEVVEVVGHFRGTMVDNLTDGIKQSLDLGGMLYDNYMCDDGLQKTTKIDCVRTDVAPTKPPSLMTDAEIMATWLNPEWSPNSLDISCR